MDSVTHIALGASIAGLIAAKPLGRKAILLGGLLCTLPDLDIFYHFDDPVSMMTYHRGVTHSFIGITVAALLLAWLFNKIFRADQFPLKKWLWFTWLCLLSHPLLDALTVYGTQLFWPLSIEPTMIGSMFIVDPLYTLPLLISFIALLIKPQNKCVQCINCWSLILSTLYLAMSLILQQVIYAKVDTYLQQHNIAAEKVLATPTPLTIAAWRVVVMNENGYYEGFYGFLPNTREFELNPYESHNELKNYVENSWAFKRIAWFSNGFYKLARENDKIYVSDLRMGFEPTYTFSFYVAKREGRDYVEIPNDWHRYANRPGIRDLGKFWCEKLWVSTVSWCQ